MSTPLRCLREKGGENVVGVSRLRQILQRARLHGFHSRGNAAVTGQHHDFRLRIARQKHRDQRQAVILADPQVQDDKFRRILGGLTLRVRGARGGAHRQAS